MSLPPIDQKKLPELGMFDLLDVFVPGGIAGTVRITRKQPLVGELILDATGRYVIAPEEDYRGGGMHGIEALGLTEEVNELVDEVVQVTGVFEDGKGLTVEAIALKGQPFADQGGPDEMQLGPEDNPDTGQP